VDGVGKEDYTYVRNSTIKSKLTVVADHAKHVFMVSDSCFSGTLLREGHRGLKVVEKTDKYYRKVAQKKSVQILAAGGLEYVDDNYKDTGHSPFTYYLMEHLKQTPERYLSATDISLEVARAVSKNVYQTPEKGVLHGAGDSNGEFFFLGPDSQPAPKPVPQAPAKRGQKAEKFDAEAEMWALVKDSDKIDDIKAFLAAFPSGKLSPVANLKLQQLERTQTRGEPAQTRDKPLVAAIPDTKPQRQGVPLAFFPCKFKNNGKRAFGKSIKVLSKMLQNAERIGEVYSYYPLSLGFNAKSIGQSLDPKELWDKGSLFSRPKPNMERVCQKAKEFGVQVVFMYFLDVIREGSTMVAYAIDVEKKAQYTAKASNVEWRLDGPRVTGNLTKKLFKDYFDNR